MLIYSPHITHSAHYPPNNCGQRSCWEAEGHDPLSTTAYTVTRRWLSARKTSKLSPSSNYVESTGCSKDLLESLHHKESSLEPRRLTFYKGATNIVLNKNYMIMPNSGPQRARIKKTMATMGPGEQSLYSFFLGVRFPWLHINNMVKHKRTSLGRDPVVK